MHFDRTTQQYLRLLEALDQAVIATDAAGVITFWSPVAETLYGWRDEEVIGRNVLDVTPMELSRSEGEEIMQTLARGELWSGAFRVRKRRGKPFVASVTDVPLLTETGAVEGVIGVSAESSAPTAVRSLLTRFSKACAKVWPKQLTFDVVLPRNARIAATAPHMIQLLSLLILLHEDSLDRGAGVSVRATNAKDSPFADFGLAFAPSAIYIRIDRSDSRTTYSVLRSLPFSAEPTKYASALVRMVGGMLMASTAPDRPSAMHLFLPVE